MTSHIRKWKEKKKDELKGLAEEYPFIAVATLDELPADIISLVRKRLAGDAVVCVSKTRVLRLALEEANFDTKKLDPVVKESVAIIFSKKNPFELFSFIKKNKGSATAKVGDIASEDIVIQAGDSGLPPGPALSTLKAAGLQVKVAGPTIEISKDKTVTKKGEEVTSVVADVLGKLNMKPMKIGMKVLGVYDKSENEFYASEVLDVDEEELFNKFVTAYQQALNLAVNAEIFNDVSVELIIIKAEREARAVNEVIAEGTQESESASPKEEKKEEPKEEAPEVKEEPKEEKSEETPKESGVEATPQEPSAEVKEDAPVEDAKEEALMEEIQEEKVEEKVEEAPSEEVKETPSEKENKDLDEKAEALEEEVTEEKKEEASN